MIVLSRPGVWLVPFLLWLASAAWAETPVPPLNARVTDLTATLTADQRRALEGELQEIEARSGSQIAIFLVPSTAPEAIEQYSMRVAEAWKLGRKDVDNGLLLLVAKNDRKLRIEVGYGLEGTIPDAVARRVVDETIAPHFKAGDFAGGIEAGVRRIAELIDGRNGTAQAGQGAGDNADEAGRERGFGERLRDQVSEVPLWLIVLLIALGTGLRWFLGPLFGGLASGGLVGLGTWWVSGTLEIALFAGVLAFVFVLVGLANWIGMILDGASGSGGGSSSGDSFSGGGGSFGGGGASGSW